MITIDGKIQGAIEISLDVTNVLTVGDSGAQYTSIQAAINAASSGTTIWVFPGTYAETITLKDGVDIVAINPEATTISQQVSDNNVECNCHLDITISLALDLQNANSVITASGLLMGYTRA